MEPCRNKNCVIQFWRLALGYIAVVHPHPKASPAALPFPEFLQVCDIAYNWENTEVVSRAFGSDPKQVTKMSCEYMKGAHTIDGFSCVAKHFPGNGLDFRDAHLSNNVNNFDLRKWNATYGKVYKALIKNGLEAVMAGHIMLPKVAKALNSKLKDEDMSDRYAFTPEEVAKRDI